MSITRQRKIILGVLGLCGVALITDRVFLASGQADAAPDVASEFMVDRASTADDSPADDLRELAARRSVVGVGQRLADFAQAQPLDASTLSDPFLPEWVSPLPRQANASTSGLSVTHDPTAFVREYRLTAVMGAGPSQYAIVSGHLLRRGDAIGPFRLTEISERTARFENPDGRTVELNLSHEAPISLAQPQAQP